MTKKQMAVELINKHFPNDYDYVKNERVNEMVKNVKKQTIKIWYDNEFNGEKNND